MALPWFDLQRAAYNDSANDGFWKRGTDGKICDAEGKSQSREGPTWNFSHPAAANYWVDEVVGELTREAPAINSVFFDETDYEFCGGGNSCGGPCGGLAPHCDWAQLYRDKIAALRRTAIKLNQAGIWPMFSVINQPGSKRCGGLDYSEYFDALSDVGWIRFYEFFDFSVLENFVHETALGLPVVVHARALDTASLASFLIGQGPYTYFGTSRGWTDNDWSWHADYDVRYGKPLGPPVKNASGWFREFSGCSVFVAGAHNASITLKK